MYINFKTVKEIIVLAKPLKQFIFGGTIAKMAKMQAYNL